MQEVPETDLNNKTPEESLGRCLPEDRGDLKPTIVAETEGCSPTFFESLVVEVIVKMGYGGTRQDAGKAIGKAGDGGIDGIIKEDKLGLDAIYIQAKRWENTVGRPEIQKFVGALAQPTSQEGPLHNDVVLLVGSRRLRSRIEAKIVLINGEILAQLMIDHNVGVAR